MQKNYYYNTQYSNENNIQKKIITHPHIKQLKNVDIKNLLIDIKIKKNKNNKKKTIFYSSSIFAIFAFAYIIF